MPLSDWALVGASIGLVMATVLLAFCTWALYKATRRLSVIEERRDQEEARRLRRARVGRKLELAEQVVHMPSETLLKPLVLGGIPQGMVAVFRKLHHHLDFGSDKVLKEDVDKLLLAFDGANRGATYPDAIKDLEPVLKRVQERLSWDLFNWRNELVNLSPELE
ncbi:MAG: hypothetical protein KAR39_07120 [Thermoplasmata archaeon]|nr:hypothetical protein [Thermoplasmata archaeon]